MRVNAIDNRTNFKNLNTVLVTHPESKKLIQRELKELRELGKDYNILMISNDRSKSLGTEMLTVSVYDKSLKSFERQTLVGINSYPHRKTVAVDSCDSVVGVVKRIITNLNKK